MYYNQYNPCPNCPAQMLNPQMPNPQIQGTQMGSSPMLNVQIPNSQMVKPMTNPQMMNPQMMNGDMMCIPSINPVMEEIQNQELKMMYPKAYYLIMTHVKHHCDMMENKHGATFRPNKRQLEEIKDEIFKCIDKALDDCDDDDEREEKKHHRYYDSFAFDNDCVEDEEYRQPRYNRNRAVRDLIGVALIGELLGRGQFGLYPPYGPYVPYYPYPPVYGFGFGGYY
jgi:hypothetical protein